MWTGLLCGALLGFVMQRGRFCITGAFRDLYITKNSKMFVALLIAITVQSIGFFAFKSMGWIQTEPAEPLAIMAVLLGSFLFGIGIILAGGCATGTWYRAGEGLVGSWAALATYISVPSCARVHWAISTAACVNSPLTTKPFMTAWVFHHGFWWQF